MLMVNAAVVLTAGFYLLGGCHGHAENLLNLPGIQSHRWVMHLVSLAPIGERTAICIGWLWDVGRHDGLGGHLSRLQGRPARKTNCCRFAAEAKSTESHRLGEVEDLAVLPLRPLRCTGGA